MTNCISRRGFLYMLGGRYGWTPPGRDRSITADEVHYAALDQAGRAGHPVALSFVSALW